MAELTIREVEPAIVAKLEERAEMHRRSVEEEHKAILRLALLGDSDQLPQTTFEEYLRMMPDVGTDDDFSRIEGSIRDVDLTKLTSDQAASRFPDFPTRWKKLRELRHATSTVAENEHIDRIIAGDV